MSRSRERGRAHRGLLVAIAVALAWVVPVQAAGAHARLVQSAPADGATVANPPRRIELRFSEAVSERFRRVQLLDAHGTVVAGTRLRAGGDRRSLVLDVPAVRHGTYQLAWEVLAEDDGHLSDGALVFGVGARPGAVARDQRGPPLLDTLLRWAELACLAGAIGALAVSLLGLGAPAAPWRRLVTAGAACAAGGVAVGALLLLRQVQAVEPALASGTGFGDAAGALLGDRWGVLWVVREGLLALLFACAVGIRRRPAGAVRLVVLYAVAGALAAGLAVARALAGHAAAAGWPVVVATSVHVLAAALWVGGVPALALALWSLRGEGGAARRLAAAWGRPFAAVAATSVVLLVASGLLEAGAQVASVDGLLTTGYGRTLISKAALVVLAGGLGLLNAMRLRRRGGPPRLLLAETAALAGVLLTAATLTGSAPPRGPEFAPPRPVAAPELAAQAGDLLVSATARPNRAGPNVVSVLAVSSRRPPPAPIDRVTVRLSRASGGDPRLLVLRESSPGRWSGGAELDRGGWRMTVAVRRGGRVLESRFDWAVGAADPARPVVVSARPLAPLLRLMAGLVIALAIAAALAPAAARRLRGRSARGPRFAPIDPIREEAT